jgi:hypothetical protein
VPKPPLLVGIEYRWAWEPKFNGFVRHEVHVIEGGADLSAAVAAVVKLGAAVRREANGCEGDVAIADRGAAQGGGCDVDAPVDGRDDHAAAGDREPGRAADVRGPLLPRRARGRRLGGAPLAEPRAALATTTAKIKNDAASSRYTRTKLAGEPNPTATADARHRH